MFTNASYIILFLILGVMLSRCQTILSILLWHFGFVEEFWRQAGFCITEFTNFLSVGTFFFGLNPAWHDIYVEEVKG